MWYVVDILFAQKSDCSSEIVQCESCNVLFEAPSALIAYEKAEKWAAEHEKDSAFKYVGICNVKSLGCTTLGEGTEVGGSFFEEKYFWNRINDFIPDKSEIAAIVLEANTNTPIGELMSDETKKRIGEQFRKVLGDED
jgi:hypothetical protein